MPYKPVSNYAEFRERVENFHDKFSPCDTLTYCYVYSKIHIEKRIASTSEDGIRLTLEAYLKHWGKMQRWLDNVDLTSEVQRIINSNLNDIQTLQSLTITSNEFFQELEVIQALFDKISNIKFNLKNQKRTFNSTATGKFLHMLLPQICVIWDREIVRNKWGLGDDGRSYVEYLKKKRSELENILQERTIQEIELEHTKYLESIGFSGAHEPITKLLDEINYF
jgi:hypothetical protein